MTMTLDRMQAGELTRRFTEVRRLTETLASRLSPEDQAVQSMPDASPTKWHRAHTTWFFEEFVLGAQPLRPVYDPTFRYLFNSYYEAVGARHPRPERGLVTRPSAAEVGRYRAHVDDRVLALLAGDPEPSVLDVVELGLHHEQQHQELLVMDALHLLSKHPFAPAMVERHPDPDVAAAPLGWRALEGGLHQVGHGGDGFGYDNEGPSHLVHLVPFEIADRTVTNEEWLAFIADDGYTRPELWLSQGWALAQQRGWGAPERWRKEDDRWWQLTSAGLSPLRRGEPVCHVSFFEADAYARWAGARLPTEQEWEVAARPVGTLRGQLLDAHRLHPGLTGPHMLGDVWEWTSSAYLPYPGYRSVPGALGEYNGKFMSDQHVLRGASCATPAGHERLTYRNFYPGDARWAFSGLRLARS